MLGVSQEKEEKMIDSGLVDGIKIPPFDRQVTEVIDSYLIDGGGNTMVIGIQNMNGDIYRVIHTTGMGAYMDIVYGLADIGLKDKLQNSIMLQNGYDSLFVVTDEIKNSYTHKEEITAIDEISAEESNLKELSETERESIIKSRLGQGIFRQSLINYWHGCAVTDCTFPQLLKASHIKPWQDSNNIERLDKFNGLLLSPNLDTAFDNGYISFDNKGKIIISTALDIETAYSLRITPKLKIKQKLLADAHQKYLDYHRNKVLKNG